MSLTFRGTTYLHRWSKGGIHEFTPEGQKDLESWTDMFTISVFEKLGDERALELGSKSVLASYAKAGKVVRALRQNLRTPPEYFVGAVVSTPKFVEVNFNRMLLRDSVTYSLLYCHRVYGSAVSPEVGQWMAANGAYVETALLDWTGLPGLSELKSLE